MANKRFKKMKPSAKKLAKMGRKGDTILAHLEPWEAKALDKGTDGGSINPKTGLMEFYDEDSDRADEDHNDPDGHNQDNNNDRDNDENEEKSFDDVVREVGNLNTPSEQQLDPETQAAIDQMGKGPTSEPSKDDDAFDKMLESLMGEFTSNDVKAKGWSSPDEEVKSAPRSFTTQQGRTIEFYKELALRELMGGVVNGVVGTATGPFVSGANSVAGLTKQVGGVGPGSIGSNVVDYFRGPEDYTEQKYYDGKPVTTENFEQTRDEPGKDNDGNLVDVNNGPYVEPETPEARASRAYQAYLSAIAGIDERTGERGFTGRGFEEGAKTKALNTLKGFGESDPYENLLNKVLGRDFAEQEFGRLDTTNRNTGLDAVKTSFGGDQKFFDPMSFSTTLDNILQQGFTKASSSINNAGARGNLSARGSAVANESLLGQQPKARERVNQLRDNVLSTDTEAVRNIGNRAQGAAQGYDLGEELFNIQPYNEEKDKAIVDKTASFEGDVNSQLGNESLYSIPDALFKAGSRQGVVSGKPQGNAGLLDTLAARATQANQKRDRGLGSRGSGVF